jgi:hypothetical protein
VVAAAPYIYVVARDAGRPVVVAGTWLDEARKLEPTWKLNGEWIVSREDETRCLVGRNVARQFRLAPGDPGETRVTSGAACSSLLPESWTQAAPRIIRCS